MLSSSPSLFLLCPVLRTQAASLTTTQKGLPATVLVGRRRNPRRPYLAVGRGRHRLDEGR